MLPRAENAAKIASITSSSVIAVVTGVTSQHRKRAAQPVDVGVAALQMALAGASRRRARARAGRDGCRR